MATAELTEKSTTEEANEHVEQIAKEVEAERAEEEKDDARITSEHADNEHKETPAEADSGSEDDTAPKGEETGDSEVKAEDWLDDDLKAEVAAYGIEEPELADFTSREELERALKLFDKSALEAGRKALAEAGGKGDGQAREEKTGRFEKKEEPKADSPKRDGQYEVALNTDTYDEEIVGEFTRMRDHYDSRMEAMESRFAEADAVARERHFDSLVDSLGHADLFGKTDKETPKQKGRREDLFVEAETYLAGRATLGRPAELSDTVLSRVARSLFADELGKKELKSRTRKVSKQSDGRQGGGVTRPRDPREDPRDEFGRLYDELDGQP